MGTFVLEVSWGDIGSYREKYEESETDNDNP